MFIRLANAITKVNAKKETDLFNLHPLQITAFLDTLWEAGRTNPRSPSAPLLPDAGIGSPPPQTPPGLRDALLRSLQGPYKEGGVVNDLGGDFFPQVVDLFLQNYQSGPRHWEHLIYAYCIENTRVYEVCHKLLVELIHGERLGSLSMDSHRWVRTTEDLFFRDTVPSLIATLVSTLRPDIRATRRNAYYRMFGMDLNHGTADSRPYPYEKTEASNQDFAGTFEAFLRELWRGYINASNTSGPNTTDNAVIAELARRLYDMLLERRRNGNLSREEFVSVAAMSWFHVTLNSNSPVIVDVKADASTPEERLRRLGERVGVGSHSRSRAFFTLALPLARLLSAVENGDYNTPAEVQVLYDPNAPGSLSSDTLNIIHHWSAATGRDIKATVVVSRAC